MKKVQAEFNIRSMLFLPNVKVIIIAASSLDGKIARLENDSLEWTSQEDKNFLKELLDQVDLCIVGRKSYDLAQAVLSHRNCLVFSRNLLPATNDIQRPEESPILTYVNPLLVDFEHWLLHNFSFPRKSVAILGGSEIYRFFLSRGWVDELYLTIEPRIFGTGISLLSQSTIDLDIELSLLGHIKMNKQGTLLLHYSVRNSRN